MANNRLPLERRQAGPDPRQARSGLRTGSPVRPRPGVVPERGLSVWSIRVVEHVGDALGHGTAEHGPKLDESRLRPSPIQQLVCGVGVDGPKQNERGQSFERERKGLYRILDPRVLVSQTAQAGPPKVVDLSGLRPGFPRFR